MPEINSIFDNVNKTKETMIDNMDKLLERGDKLENLKNKTGEIESEAKLFAEAAHELQARARSRYMALTFIIIGMSLGATYTIIMGCGTAIIAGGTGAGGFLGYSFNWVRSMIMEALSPSSYMPGPLKRERLSKRELPKDSEHPDLAPSRNVLSAYNLNQGSVPSVSTPPAKTKIKP